MTVQQTNKSDDTVHKIRTYFLPMWPYALKCWVKMSNCIFKLLKDMYVKCQVLCSYSHLGSMDQGQKVNNPDVI